MAGLPLLERDSALRRLGEAIAGLSRGGRCVLVSGEPGIGKTRLLQAARQAHGDAVEWWSGSCEPLLAPLPLTPLLDIHPALPPRITQALGQGVTRLLPELLAHARSAPRPLVLAIDDVHWADDATLDLLRLLARRLDGLPLLLVLAWRDTDVAGDHPLQRLLAGMGNALRLPLQPLSATAVARLAKVAGRTAEGLFDASGGNPFCVSELLDGPPGEVLPPGVREAVLARWRPLRAAARELLEWACVSPAGLEPELLQRLYPHDAAALRQALASGLLRETRGSIRIAHELARMTLLDELGPRAAALHAALFDALGDAPPLLARRVHHAAAAGLGAAVLKLAPVAAAQAAAAGAHRQAAQLYGLALVQTTTPPQRLALLDARAEELLLTNQLEAARATGEEAAALARQLGDSGTERTLRLARIAWLDGRPRDGLAAVAAAIDALRNRPAGPALAQALVLQAQLHLRNRDLAPALPGASQALALFEQAGDRAGQAQALATLGAAALGGSEHALALRQLQQALDIALAESLEELAGRLYVNLAAAALVDGRLPELSRWYAAGLAYCDARDLELHHINLQLRLVCGDLAAGRWPKAEQALQTLLSQTGLNGLQRRLTRQLQALQAMRHATPGADAAWADAQEQRDLPWFMSTELQQVELAALRGDKAVALALVERALAKSNRRDERWCHAELQIWRLRLGERAELRDDAPAPFAREAAGDRAGAAQAWADLGMPYAQALTLLHGDADQLRQALALLLPMGATLAAQCARRRLRELGVASAAGIPRGPYKHRRGDPLGLSARERQVLDGLREGLSNRAIAERLHRSERTIEQHVAALLHKLRARNRGDAARLADSEN